MITAFLHNLAPLFGSSIPSGFIFVDTTGIGEIAATLLERDGFAITRINRNQARLLLGDKLDALRFRSRSQKEQCDEESSKSSNTYLEDRRSPASQTSQSALQHGKPEMGDLIPLVSMAPTGNCSGRQQGYIDSWFVRSVCRIASWMTGVTVKPNDSDQATASARRC
jgi:hypothetical protein